MPRRHRITRRSVAALAIVAGLAAGCRPRAGDKDEHDAQAGADNAPVVAPSRLADDGGTAVVMIPDSQRVAFGLALAPLRSGTARAEQQLVGEVVAEPERVTTLRAPVAGRLRMVGGERWPSFGASVRAGGAVAQVSDALPLTIPVSGTVSRVLAQPGEFVQPGQALLEITDFSHPLVRVAFPLGAARPPAHVALAPAGARVDAALVSAAPSADSLTGRPAFLFRAARTWPGARPGAAVPVAVATVETGAQGTVVPAAAVVQWDGLAWAFVRREAGRYARVRVPTSDPVDGGWLVPGLSREDSVVVRGAEQLLSEEFRSRVTVGDESGD
jgi:biotin carboxyl carrier protein